MDIPFQWLADVRDYEVVEQGIVSNANYLNYYEQARIEYFKSIGIYFSEFLKLGYYFVMAKVEVDFLRALVAGDSFYVTCKISSYTEKRIQMHQEIRLRKTDKLMSKCYCEAACVSVTTHKAIMPNELVEYIEKQV